MLSRLFLLWLLAASLAAPAAGQTLRVATKNSPPFAYRDQAGGWTGISIDLWEEIARELGLEYELVEVETPRQLVTGVAEGDFDLGVAAISMTAARERIVDFSHSFYSTGLGVAVRGGGGSGLERILRGLVSWQFLTLAGSVLLGLVGMAYLFWLVERRENKQFAEHRQGVSQGFWWSTILLFGHKGVFPVSVAGRLLAATSMLVSILALSVLTGAIASALTVGHFESVIRDYQDLRYVRTAAVEGTSAADFLHRERIAFQAVTDVDAGLEALAGEQTDALIHDAPLLEYEIGRNFSGRLELLPRTFEFQDYGFVLPPEIALRERINAALLDLRSGPRWQEIQYRHLRR